MSYSMRTFNAVLQRANLLCVRGGITSIRSFETRAEYAFETASSNVRFGRGTTGEVGDDILGMKINEDVCVFTDENLSNLAPARAVFDSLTRAGIRFEVYDRVKIEPTDKSMQMAIDFCRNRSKPFRAFVAVGGGSVIDTAKTANLYMCNPASDFLDFVNAPIGKGLPVTSPLAPLIAIPTTAGTGSETTGIAIFDHIATGAKTGIRDRALRPTLGIIDPEHTKHCSKELTAYTGLDVLCHALESFTAIPFRQRGPAPASPLLRPAYQGSNPLSDIWSGYALQVCAKNIISAVELGDPDAREQMGLAATAAGVGFGNAGVHLCHAMSYPISSNVRGYRPLSGYGAGSAYGISGPGTAPQTDDGVRTGTETGTGTGTGTGKKGLVPHGLSVVLTAPAVFRWTVSADPDKHLRAAALMGANTANVKPKDAGLLLSDTLIELLGRWTDFVPDGLEAVGYSRSDLDILVKGTLPQKKVLDVAPRKVQPDDVAALLDRSMRLFT